MRLRLFHLSVCLLLLMMTVLARAGDIPKSADHPLIKRYEGSTIIRYEQKAFNAYQLVVGPLVGRGSDAHFPKVLKPEGRVTRITYLVPAGRSPLEVFRNYDQDLKKAGFTTLFTGAHEALGQKRLKPVGVSFASPIASNGTEDGRSKNRRVQLVENISSSAPR